MSRHRHTQGHGRWIPLAGTAITLLVAGLCFDFYYQLNDDVVIKDLLSGAYTGRPEGYTNQLLFPLGAVFAALYGLLQRVPVFALSLLFFFALSFTLIGLRSIQYFHSRVTKAGIILLEVGVFLTMYLWELVYVQYSVVCGTLMAAACFWFYTTREEETGKFWLANLPSLLLVWLAFGLRSEMALLLSPFAAVTGLWHWGSRRKRISFKRYLLFALAGVLGCVLLLAGDYAAAYAKPEWQSYRDFFDARTQVYDYTWYPSYEEASEYYESVGMSQTQYELMDSYNFALDPSIDSRMLEAVADYGERARHQGSPVNRLRDGVWELAHRMVTPMDAPYNYFVLTAYALVVGISVIGRKKEYIWRLLLLGMVRIVPWMYLILAERVVERIAHPLYFIEFVLLMALLAEELRDRPLWNVEKLYRRFAFAALLILIVITGRGRFIAVRAEQLRRQETNQTMEAFREYARAKPEHYFFLDVYSTVAYSELLFEEHTNSRKNYDILGGWVCHSPLQKKALENALGEVTDKSVRIDQALLTESVFFVIRDGRPADSLLHYYEEQGKTIQLTEEERIGTGTDVLVVYQLQEKEESGTTS